MPEKRSKEYIEFRANLLRDRIAKDTAELDSLRLECPHETYKVGMYMWRLGAFTPQRVCDTCGAVVGGLTEEEEKKCWETWTSSITEGGK